MKPYQKRVIKEKKLLDEKRERLNAFIATPDFDLLHPIEQHAMTLQWSVMTIYSDILKQRISRFNE